MLDIFATNRALNFTTSIPSLVRLGILCFKTDDVFILMQIKPFFAREGFAGALNLVLKGRVFGTWKWPINMKKRKY